MFDSMMKEILDQVGGLSSQNTELHALLRNILEVKIFVFILSCTTSVLQFNAYMVSQFKISLRIYFVSVFFKTPFSILGNGADN